MQQVPQLLLPLQLWGLCLKELTV